MAASDSLIALRSPVVRRFAVGRIISVLGAQMVSVAVGWQLYERKNSAFALGVVGLVVLIPFVLLALPAGHLADRFRRRDVAMFAHALLAASSIGLALVAARNGPVGAIYALLFCTGVGVAFRSPSVSWAGLGTLLVGGGLGTLLVVALVGLGWPVLARLCSPSSAAELGREPPVPL